MKKEYMCAREFECDSWVKGKEVEEVQPDTITLKRIYSTHCQVCRTPHSSIEIVFFVPLDNNIVCHDCAIDSGYPYEPRIYKEG